MNRENTVLIQGDRRPGPNPKPPLERFFGFVAKDGPLFDGSPCWLWTGKRTTRGYGCFQLYANNATRYTLAHRWLWKQMRGAIAADLTLDHRCRRRECVNPDHLEPVPLRENILRGASPFADRARQTHCKRGHPFTEENTIRRPGRPTLRECRACENASQRERKQRRQQNAID